MSTWYCTREDVKSALDSKDTARNDGQVDRAIEAASRGVEGFLRRRFYPEITTRAFDWPDRRQTRTYRLWLDGNEVISVTAVVSGGVTIDAADYDLRRSDDLDEPPYDRIEIDQGSSAAFSSGPTWQKAISVTGLFGYSLDETAVGVTAEALDTSETGMDVDAATSAAVGVGSLLRVDSERVIVTGRRLLTTGLTLQTPMTNLNSNDTVAVTDGTLFALGEVITLDSERMLIVDIAGNSLIVKRAWDGSTIAAHTGSTIYAPRTLTVTRGALGTTAASHLTAASVLRFEVPGLVRQLCIAEAENDLLQQSSGYARTVGAGESEREASGRGLEKIRDRAFTRYGRRLFGSI